MQLKLLSLPPQPARPSFTLRPYQRRMIDKTYDYIRQGVQRVLIVAIMGAGKTAIASWIMRDAVSRGRRCLFLVSLNVLLDQTTAALEELGVDCTVLQGDRPVDMNAPVIVASLQTIKSRITRGKGLDELLGCVDVCIPDEAHITAFDQTYQDIEKHYINSCIFIGLTATPWRRSREQWLGQKFDASVVGPQPPEIIRLGGAVPCRGFTFTNALDLDELHIRNGEYIDKEISDQATRLGALNHIFNEWTRLASDRPTLMIGATVDQAQATSKRFLESDVPTEVIVGSTSYQERSEIFERVKQGKTKIITSVGCLTFGFNLPCISAILYVRATKSRALFHQSAGRGSRPSSGKSDYLLLDFGGNLKRHGNPMGFQDYSIEEKPKPTSTHTCTKTCPECGHECWNLSLVCPECGHLFEPKVKTLQEEEDAFLEQLNEFFDSSTRNKVIKLRAWKRQAMLSDVSPDEPITRFTVEYGHIPPNDWLLNACLRKNASQVNRAKFTAYLHRHLKKSNTRPDDWISHHMHQEFGEDTNPAAWWWTILNCQPTTIWKQVKNSYRDLARRYHPDICGEADAVRKMTEINLAFEMAKEHYQVQQEIFF